MSSMTPTVLAGFASSANALPPMVALPLSGRVSPVSMRSVVDLPAPLAPRKPVMVPGSHENVTPCTAFTVPYRLLRFAIEIMGSAWSRAGPATSAARPRRPVRKSAFGRARLILSSVPRVSVRPMPPAPPGHNLATVANGAGSGRARTADAACVLLAAGGGLVLLVTKLGAHGQGWLPGPASTVFAVDAAIGAAASALLWFRRRWPVTVAVVLTVPLMLSRSAQLACLISVYSVSTRCRPKVVLRSPRCTRSPSSPSPRCG